MGHPLEDYRSVISAPEQEWNLFEISLHLFRMIRPELDFEPYQEYVAEISRQVAIRLVDSAHPYDLLNALNHVLFEELGFRGNQEDYYHPNNSYITCVLDEKKGIPITLSILYQEAAARLGMQLVCVGMPGHFLLKYSMPLRELFIDSFHRGEILLEEECKERLEQLYQRQVVFHRRFLQTTGKWEVVLRMLLNLKQIYRHREERELLLEVVERRIPLLRDPLAEILERGWIRLDLRQYRSALQDLEYFVENTQDRKMKQLVEEKLPEVRSLASGG